MPMDSAAPYVGAGCARAAAERTLLRVPPFAPGSEVVLEAV